MGRAQHGHGDDEHHRFLDGVDLPGNGDHPDEDVLLDDLQRGPRFHLRHRRHRRRDGLGRRILPGPDRRDAAAHQDLRRGNPDRPDRGRRRHRPQRPLPGWPARARAHAVQAGLCRRQAAGIRGRHRPHRRGRRHGAGRFRRRSDGDIPRRRARAAGEGHEAREGRRFRVEAHARERAHPSLQLRRPARHDRSAGRR